MGFLSFVSKIGSGFKSAVSTVGSGFKRAVKQIHHSILKPVFNRVLKPVYQKAIKPIAKRAITYVEHGIDRVERIADAGTKAAEGAGNFMDSIGKSPMLIAGVIAVGAIVLLKK